MRPCYTQPVAHSSIPPHDLRKPLHLILTPFYPWWTPGILRYQDTSTGHIVASHKTRLGPCSVMRQNPWNAVLGLGHAGARCLDPASRAETSLHQA